MLEAYCLHSCITNMNKELLIIINCNLYTIYKFVVTRMTTLLPILRKPVNSIKCYVIFVLTFPKTKN